MLELLGKKIGEGTTRVVHTHIRNPALVIKVAKSDLGTNANFVESEIWSYASPRDRKYFAPVEDWSDDYKYLVMHRTYPILFDDDDDEAVDEELMDLQEMFPQYLTDFTEHNIGGIEDRIVMHDYAEITWRLSGGRDSKTIQDCLEAYTIR